MTPEKLAEIKALAEKATPGPWAIESCGEKGDGANIIGVAFDPDDVNCERQMSGWLPIYRPCSDEEIEWYRDEEIAICEHRNRNSGYNAAYIAALSPDVVLALVAEIELMRQALEETQNLVVQGALTGFNPKDGDWAQKLFDNQAEISAALALAREDGK